MKMIWPDKLKLVAETIGEGLWKVNYIERFNHPDSEAIKNGANMLKQCANYCGIKMRVRVLKDGIAVSMQGTREGVYDFVVGEFLPQSSLGKITLGNLFSVIPALASMAKSVAPSSELIAPIPGIRGKLEGASKSENEPE